MLAGVALLKSFFVAVALLSLGCFVILAVYPITAPNLCSGPDLAGDFAAKENCFQNCCFAAIATFNNGQTISRLFHILVQFSFTASKSEPDYFHQRVNAQTSSRVVKRL